ncbi:MAG: hypothetical protein ACT4P1_13280 [Sporichthyaceae bacterium]
MRLGRVLLAGVSAAALMATAAGPSRLAGALSAAPAAQPAGFLPAPIPVTVTAPTLRIKDLVAIGLDQPIALAGGGRSPAGPPSAGGTVLLGFARIDLDRVRIAQSRAGEFTLAITNAGSQNRAAVIGGTDGEVELWGVVNTLDVCLPASTVRELLTANLGNAEARRILTRLLAGGSEGAGPPCTPARPLLPALSTFLERGGQLPSLVRARDLDIDVYALRADAGAGALSLSLPLGRLQVLPRG